MSKEHIFLSSNKDKDSSREIQLLQKNSSLSESLEKKNRFLIKKKVEAFNFKNIDFDQYRDEDQLKIDNIIHILNKDLNRRDEREIYIVSKFLEKTDLEKKFNNDKIDQLDLRKFILLCASFMKYHHLNKDEILFHEGEKGEKFYVILEGELNVLRCKEREVHMTSIEYLTYLFELNKKQLKQPLIKTIKSNINVFPIDKKHLEGLKEIMNHLKKKSVLRRSMIKDDAEKFLKDYRNAAENNNKNNCKNEKDVTVNKIDSELINLLNLHVQEPVRIKIFEPSLLAKLGNGKYFGDIALEKKNNIRNATIIAQQECHLGEIFIDDYIDFLFDEKEKLKQKEISFLVSNFFFRHIKNEFFESHYFHNFTYHDLRKGQILFHQNHTSEDIYLIKEGEVCLNSNFSLDGLCNLIETLSEKIKMKVKKLDRVDFDKYGNLIQEYLRPRQHKVLICNSKQVLILEESLYSFNNFYTGEVASPELKFYKINKNSLFKMIKNDKCTSKEMHNYIKEKIRALIQRLVDIRNTTFKMIMCNAEKEKTKLQNQREKEKNELKSRNMQSSFPLMKTYISYISVSRRPSNTILSTIKHEENKTLNSDKKLLLSRGESYSSLVNSSIKTKTSSYNLVSMTSIHNKNNLENNNAITKQNLNENKKSSTRPKSTEYYKGFISQRIQGKHLNKSSSLNHKKVINLNNRTLKTIHSKDHSIREIQNTEMSRTPFITSKSFPKNRGTLKSKVDNQKDNCISTKGINNQDLLFPTSLINIDGKKINSSDAVTEKIDKKEINHYEKKSSLKLFPSFVNIKGVLNIKYRKINYVKKLRSLSNKIVF